MTWAFIILIFAIAAACILILGIEIGQEKVRDDEADDERNDENHRQ